MAINVYEVLVSVPTGSVLGQQYARVTVTDDDGPAPTSTVTVSPTG